MELTRVCVFCGSNPGTDPAYVAEAEATGRALAERGIGLVYGGGSVGLMGRVAAAVMDAGGDVTGVIPEFLDAAEIAKRDITRLEVTASMHDRKARMAELSDAFLALPGGIGTFEEAFEAMTWTQLGVHDKPIGLVDVAGFWAPAAALLDRAVADGFLAEDVRTSIVVEPTGAEALDAFATWQRPGLGKWTERDVVL
ncbi:TIGR00730 family Rossman fold protein [Iamia sp. SCSIO 61187]|uniref:LOG family protein n=1 Tax=Iamia sp. SCSIO 61187 TaxID=2722752 RepID=UPI001C638825|nr:TIGR00730 family Rossman fold protein [Iamia sp. SCSIO 61187]